MSPGKRRVALFAALAAVLAWSGWLAANGGTDAADDADIELTRPAMHPLAAAMSRPPVTVPAAREVAPRLALARADLFPQQTWHVPPPPPPPAPPPAPPPPPQAPALPFRYLGHWQEAGQTTYYLARGTAPLSVRAGQVLDGVWRLEPVAGGLLNFTYLPLNQTRSLRTGD